MRCRLADRFWHTDPQLQRFSKLDPEPVACEDESTQIDLPQISQMNADGENHKDDPWLVRLADSAILEIPIR
jgi:hypothetical protein